jgi:hypothetical protein
MHVRALPEMLDTVVGGAPSDSGSPPSPLSPPLAADRWHRAPELALRRRDSFEVPAAEARSAHEPGAAEHAPALLAAPLAFVADQKRCVVEAAAGQMVGGAHGLVVTL